MKIGLISLLGVCFVVLKLTDHIDWSWWYVTLPFWWDTALIIILLIMIAIKPKSNIVVNPNKVQKVSRFQERLEKMSAEREKNKIK